MKTLIALDVDGVLMPWDDEAYQVLDSPTRFVYDRFGKKTGFKDWVYHQDSPRFLTFWSREQHDLIRQVGDVHWLTTWARENETETYTKVTEFGPFPSMRPEQSFEAEYLYRWWKMGWLYLWVRENAQYVAQYDRVLWVDDDHYGYMQQGLDDVVYQLAQVGTELVVVKPEGPVWSRAEIELWL